MCCHEAPFLKTDSNFVFEFERECKKEREGVCVCVCVSECEREGGRKSVKEREGEKERV